MNSVLLIDYSSYCENIDVRLKNLEKITKLLKQLFDETPKVVYVETLHDLKEMVIKHQTNYDKIIVSFPRNDRTRLESPDLIQGTQKILLKKLKELLNGNSNDNR